MARMRRALGLFVRGVKRIMLLAILVELTSFVLVTLSNVIIYGKAREGSRVAYDPYALFLNTDGPRRTTGGRSPRRPDRRRVVWMFGGSTTRCDDSADDQTIASQLAVALDARFPGLDIEVRNYGESSFNSLLEVKYLQKVLIENPAPPDLILFYDGFNDASYLLQYGNPGAHHGYRRIEGLISSYYRSPLGILKPLTAAFYASFTRELVEKVGGVVRPVRAGDALLRRFAEQLQARYDYVDREAQGKRARFFLIWQPFLWIESGSIDPAVAAAERSTILPARRVGAFVSNLGQANGVAARRLANRPYFIDARNALCSRRQPVYRPDGVHLYDAGNRLAAQSLAEALAARGAFEGGSDTPTSQADGR
jgi:lysophospholipase L1-like esterase